MHPKPGAGHPVVEYQQLEEAEEEAQIKARRLSSEGLEVTQGLQKLE